MKASLKLDNRSSYLDVTQFILKECSPLIKPTSPKTNLHDQKYQKTPQINPIDHDPSKFAMTPLCTGLCGPQIIDIMQEFALENVEGFCLQGKHEARIKPHRIKQVRPRSSCILQILQNEQILNMIPEMQNDDDINFYYEDYEEESEYYSDYSDSYSSEYYKSHYKEQEVEKQSTIDMSAIEFNDAIERFKQNPKKEILKHMKQIQNTMPEESLQNKKGMIKKFIEKYLLDYETYCYEEAWKQLEQYELPQMIKKIAEGLTETFSKKIGQLPFQVRRTKILKYLEKKYFFVLMEGKRESGEKRSVMIVARKLRMEGFELRGNLSLVNKLVNNQVFNPYKVTPLKKLNICCRGAWKTNKFNFDLKDQLIQQSDVGTFFPLCRKAELSYLNFLFTSDNYDVLSPFIQITVKKKKLQRVSPMKKNSKLAVNKWFQKETKTYQFTKYHYL